jgi:hypothetical protein
VVQRCVRSPVGVLGLFFTWAWAAALGSYGAAAAGALTAILAIGFLATAIASKREVKPFPAVMLAASVCACLVAIPVGRAVFSAYVLHRLDSYEVVAEQAERSFSSQSTAARLVVNRPAFDLDRLQVAQTKSGDVEATLWILGGGGRRILVFGNVADQTASRGGSCLTRLKGRWFWPQPCRTQGSSN